MKLKVYTSSSTFKQFIGGVFDLPVEFSSKLPVEPLQADVIHLVHAPSFTEESLQSLGEIIDDKAKVGVCADNPGIKQMLDCIQYGVKAYCNSFMQTQHYQHLVRLLDNGQSWFPPHLLEQTFALAHRAVSGNYLDSRLESLTNREKEVAKSVSEGLTNRQIADQFSISERTVKTHLTNIFKKLQIKDRVGLVLHLK
ncbi:MAG: response regulator transcription factor [Gammaproteobacteria bacterium]|nr:response regulator transcription factor [Gammaproteobacteria bacterium]